MFKKLIIAVLTLGLILAFSSAAISSDVNEYLKPEVRTTIDVNNPHYGQQDAQVLDYLNPSLQRPEPPASSISKVALPAPPEPYWCEDYPAFDVLDDWYAYQLPSGSGTVGFLYNFPVESNFACTLKTAWFYVYGGFTVGNPDIEVSIWSDDHGMPNVKLFSFQGTFGTDFVDGWNSVDLGGMVMFADYHMEVKAIPNVAGELVSLLTDKGSETNAIGDLRASRDKGTYFIPGWDYQPIFSMERCCTELPYTSCYTQGWIDDWYYVFGLPSASSCRDGLGVRFSVAGPETLKTAYVGLYNGGVDDGSVVVNINVYNDAGGVPTGAPLATVTLTTLAEKYPVSGYAVADFSSYNLVFTSDFHITAEYVSGNAGKAFRLVGNEYDNPAVTSYGRGTVHFPTPNTCAGWDLDTGWETFMYAYGVAPNFDIFADMCKDEYSSCKWIYDYGVPYYILGHINTSSVDGFATGLNGWGEGCRVEKIRFQLDPSVGNPGGRVSLYGDNAGEPGAEIYGVDIDPLVDWWPGWTEITLPDVPENYIVGKFYLAIHGIFHDDLEKFYIDADDASLPYTVGFTHRVVGGFLVWQPMDVTYGDPLNLVAEAYLCCVPLQEITCAQGEDWPTFAKADIRGNHTLNSIGDAKCNLTKAWRWENTTASVMSYQTPVIWKDTVVLYMGNQLVALDINTGAPIWTRVQDAFEIGSGSTATPMIMNFAAYSTPGFDEDTTYIFTGGGADRSFLCIRLLDGTTKWVRNQLSTGDTHGVTALSYGHPIFADVAGAPVVVYHDDAGRVYARDALIGTKFAGWTVNPVVMPYAVRRGFATNGSDLLFVGVQYNPTTVTNGDVYALNLADGTVAWQLSLAGGLQASTLVLPKDFGGAEGFQGGISYDPLTNSIYTYGNYAWGAQYNQGTPAEGGVFYRIGADDGSVVWAKISNGHNTANWSAPLIDAANVIHIGYSPWTTASLYYGPLAFLKENGQIAYSNTLTNPRRETPTQLTGTLSCEPDGPDFLITGNTTNYLHFMNADNGSMIFHRRFLGRIGATFYYVGLRAPVVIDDGHVIITTRNRVFCLTNAVDDRPRLDLSNISPSVSMEFGYPNHHPVAIENAIANTGCADLIVDSIIIDETTNNTNPLSVASIAPVDPKREAALSAIADDMIATKGITSDFTKQVNLNNAAYAAPIYINGVISPTPGMHIMADDTVDIVLDVNAPIVTRGAHQFYARVYTNDPDYFLDSARMDAVDGVSYGVPQMNITLVAGCLNSTERLEFGIGGDNHHIVWNTGFLAHQDSTEALVIQGQGAYFWQGGLIFGMAPLAGTVGTPGDYGLKRHRMAIHAYTYQEEPGKFYKSLLADPNCYDQICAPSLQANTKLGEISTDNGVSYVSFYGNIINVAYVDSVQDFGTYDSTGTILTEWDWFYEANNAELVPYSNSMTMGFKVCSKAIGVLDVDAMKDFYVDRVSISARNGAPINNLYMGALIDYDIGDNYKSQINGYDKAHSLGWAYEYVSPTNGWGVVKIPYGCGYEPLVLSKGLDAKPEGLHSDSALYMDSMYTWMSAQSGLVNAPNTNQLGPNDRNAYFTIAKMNLPATGSVEYAMAWFGFSDITNADDASNYFGVADIANKWLGFGRGDVNNDGKINLVDIVYLADYVNTHVHGPFPFWHTGDVNNDSNIDVNDVLYLQHFYFEFGPCPLGAWTL